MGSHSIPRYHSPSRSRDVIASVRTPPPSLTVVGEIVLEGAECVFARSVGDRHLFRALDAWSVGDYVLGQLQRWGVARLRYRAPEGTYEVGLADFLARALVRDFPHERQYLLPRREWPVRPAPRDESASPAQVALFPAEVSA